MTQFIDPQLSSYGSLHILSALLNYPALQSRPLTSRFSLSLEISTISFHMISLSLPLSEGKLAAHWRDLGRPESLFGNVCFSAECGGEASSKKVLYKRERERENRGLILHAEERCWQNLWGKTWTAWQITERERERESTHRKEKSHMRSLVRSQLFLWDESDETILLQWSHVNLLQIFQQCLVCSVSDSFCWVKL